MASNSAWKRDGIKLWWLEPEEKWTQHQKDKHKMFLAAQGTPEQVHAARMATGQFRSEETE